MSVKTKTIQERLSEMSLLELQTTLNKYCQPDSQLLCIKKFGSVIPAAAVEQEIMERILTSENPDFK